MTELYIGLMSGTSADGIDAALVNFSTDTPSLVATHYAAHPESLRTKILELCQPGTNEVERLGELDHLLGKAFAKTANELLQKESLANSNIKAIGSHGQTIRHHPRPVTPFTLQIGDPNIIAAETGITTIADFRRKDVALGGQGAPLVPAFHQAMFSSDKMNRAIVNIGGIANVTLLPLNKSSLIGFDTGPGNVLLDAWIQSHQQKKHDDAGKWGATGKCQANLLEIFLSDPFFSALPPKSTGREHFNLSWTQKMLATNGKTISPVDVQATLVELTAASIVNAIQNNMSEGEILICGGGAHNEFLMSRLRSIAAPSFKVHSTDEFGIHPDWVEAIAFAWLAKQTLNKVPGNIPSVTGASKSVVLGGVYFV